MPEDSGVRGVEKCGGGERGGGRKVPYFLVIDKIQCPCLEVGWGGVRVILTYPWIPDPSAPRSQTHLDFGC